MNVQLIAGITFRGLTISLNVQCDLASLRFGVYLAARKST